MTSPISTPYIELGEGRNFPHSIEEGITSATLGTEIKLRPFQELSQYNWEWSAKGVLQNNIERTGLLFASLNDGLDTHKEYRERLISVRFIQGQPGTNLKMAMLARVIAETQKISDVVKSCWLEMLSIHHYDYAVSPISSEEDMREKTGQSWLLDRSKPISVSIVHPAVGFLNVPGKESNHSIPIVGKWSPTTTSLENVWRALNNYPYPVMMDILLKAAILEPDELIGFDTLLSDLKSVVDGNGSIVTRTQAGQWLEVMSSRLSKFSSVYLMQVRLATLGDMLSYLPRVIGTALTFQSTIDQNLPFQGFNVISRQGEDSSNWAQKIAGLEFIDPEIAYLPVNLRNLPFYATTTEALSVARFVFTPKGGIPNLMVEEP